MLVEINYKMTIIHEVTNRDKTIEVDVFRSRRRSFDVAKSCV